MLTVHTSPAPKVRQLRYTFDSWDQAQAHIHAADGRLLLFYPAPHCPLIDGERVLLEITFADCDQTVSLSGQVHSRGEARGYWLELFAARVFDLLRMALQLARRRYRRMATDRMLRVRRDGQCAMGRLTDVGLYGARIAHGGGAWSKGVEVLLEQLDGGRPLRARVVWSDQREAALEFNRNDAQTRAAAEKLFAEVLRSWEAAPLVRHPAACTCSPVLEPLLPRTSRMKRAEAS